MGKLIFGMLAAAVSVSARSDAASISTVYDMNRMLNEPHPMADEYGTRWAPPPSSGYGAPLQVPSTQAFRPIAPIPSTSSAPVPSASSPTLAPVPPLPPSIPTPTLRPAPIPVSADPAPPPAAAPKPTVNPAPPLASSPKTKSGPATQDPGGEPALELSPRLSLDTGGLDVDVVKTAPPLPPPDLPGPGK